MTKPTAKGQLVRAIARIYAEQFQQETGQTATAAELAWFVTDLGGHDVDNLRWLFRKSISNKGSQ